MSSRPAPPAASLPALPHWEQVPADLAAAIRQTKAALRARIAASGRTVEKVFAVVQDQIAHEVGEITAARERGEMIWPVIDYADIEAGMVPAGTQDLLRRPTMRPRSSGCTAGGNGSTRGSPRTTPAGYRRWRSRPETTWRNRPGNYPA